LLAKQTSTRGHVAAANRKSESESAGTQARGLFGDGCLASQLSEIMASVFSSSARLLQGIASASELKIATGLLHRPQPVVDAVLDAVLDGVLDALLDGVLDAVLDGVLDAVLDGVLDALLDCVLDCVLDGVFDVVLDGVLEAVLDTVLTAGRLLVSFTRALSRL
jgi:hypothetical protein